VTAISALWAYNKHIKHGPSDRMAAMLKSGSHMVCKKRIFRVRMEECGRKLDDCECKIGQQGAWKILRFNWVVLS